MKELKLMKIWKILTYKITKYLISKAQGEYLARQIQMMKVI